MALNFPSSPTPYQVYIPTHEFGSGPIYEWSSSAQVWRRRGGTALPQNKFVNPSFQISQQNGDNSFNNINGGYFADQWYVGLVLSGGGLVYQRMTAFGTKTYFYGGASPLQATMAAGNYCYIVQSIEGSRIADMNYNSPGGVFPGDKAQYGVLRFRAGFPQGTWCVSVRNAPNTHSWTGNFTVPVERSGLEQDYSFVVPPLTVGTTATDHTYGMSIGFCMASGTTYGAGVNGQWVAGNMLATPQQTNGLANWNSFTLVNVGFYRDPNMTGVAPPFQQNHIEDDLEECQRYWYKAFGQRGLSHTVTQGHWMSSSHPVPMRITPVVSLVGTTLRLYDGTNATNAVSVTNAGSTGANVVISSVATTMIVGRSAGLLVDSVETNYVACSAR